MKSFRRLFATIFLAFAAILTASAQTFFDMSEAERFFTVGARFDLNTTVRTIGTHDFNAAYNRDNWGLGFDVGAVANLNIFDAFSLQPGFFIGSRHGSYSYYSGTNPETGHGLVQLGSDTRCVITIPVMVAAHFNVTDMLRWDVEFGPYLMCNLGHSSKVDVSDYAVDPSKGRSARGDFGFKMGSGFTYDRKYSFAIHYLAGAQDAWKNGLGGRNKGWTFAIGYDF